MNQKRGKKIFHICMVIAIIATILFASGMIILQYQVEGETNLPFQLSKIVVVSTAEGIDKEKSKKKWDLSVNQNNDIYIYIEKNDEYNKTEVIKKIILENFQTVKKPSVGVQAIYLPSQEEGQLFKNKQKDQIDRIEYQGDLNTDIKKRTIGNQGGIMVFRYALNNVSNYTSDKDKQINHAQLLQKTKITNEQLQSKITMDLLIELVSGTVYKGTINVGTPVGDIVNEGTGSLEITNFDDVVFKRVEK